MLTTYQKTRINAKTTMPQQTEIYSTSSASFILEDAQWKIGVDIELFLVSPGLKVGLKANCAGGVGKKKGECGGHGLDK